MGPSGSCAEGSWWTLFEDPPSYARMAKPSQINSPREPGKRGGVAWKRPPSGATQHHGRKVTMFLPLSSPLVALLGRISRRALEKLDRSARPLPSPVNLQPYPCRRAYPPQRHPAKVLGGVFRAVWMVARITPSNLFYAVPFVLERPSCLLHGLGPMRAGRGQPNKGHLAEVPDVPLDGGYGLLKDRGGLETQSTHMLLFD